MTSGSMTKAELVEEVSRVSDLTKKHSEVIVDTVFKSIIDALHRGEKIELRGFGSFRLRKREPRKGRNPKTGDKVDVPPKKVPYFKPGKELKELINREAEAAEAVSITGNVTGAVQWAKLWSPWRLAYLLTRTTRGRSRSGRFFCDSNGLGRTRSFFTGRPATSSELYPYNNGHLMVVPNRTSRSRVDDRESGRS
jgi:integration host factor subunit beta